MAVMKLLKRIRLMDGITFNAGEISIDPSLAALRTDYPWSVTAACILDDGTLFAGQQVYKAINDGSDYYRCWHFTTDGTILGTFDTSLDFIPGHLDLSTICEPVGHGRVLVFIGGTFRFGLNSDVPTATMVIDCSKHTPTLVSTNTFHFPDGSRAILGDTFASNQHYTDRGHNFVAVLHETWRNIGGFGTNMTVLERDGTMRGTVKVNNTFETVGLAHAPDDPSLAAAQIGDNRFSPAGVETITSVRLDLATMKITSTIIDPAPDSIAANMFVVAQGSPFANGGGYWVSDETNRGVGTIHVVRLSDNKVFTFESGFDEFFSDGVMARANLLIWTQDGGVQPDDHPTYDKFGWQYYVSLLDHRSDELGYEQLALPLPEDLPKDTTEGLESGSASSSWDPASGLMIFGYNILSDARAISPFGTHVTATVWLVQGPPDPEPYVRTHQRDDGLGVVRHPRLDAGNSPSSIERRHAPRIGEQSTYG